MDWSNKFLKVAFEKFVTYCHLNPELDLGFGMAVLFGQDFYEIVVKGECND